MDSQARPCFLLNFGYNHGSDCFKIMDAETGRTVHLRDVTWHQQREPLTPAPTVGSGMPQSSSGVMKRRTTCTFSWHLQLLLRLPPGRCLRQPTPHPRRYKTPPPQFPIALFGNWGTRQTCVMPGRTRGETRAMRDSPQSMGLMSHAALAQGMATRKAFDETFREYGLPSPDADLPTSPASDVPIPSTIAEAESSEHAEIWRGFRTREFRGLQQPNTFGPA